MWRNATAADVKAGDRIRAMRNDQMFTRTISQIDRTLGGSIILYTARSHELRFEPTERLQIRYTRCS